nr:uncharacterized mitochondrial protein AtMg00810-like [Tanacetum cinerariifolium]
METQKPLLKDKDGKEVDVHMYRSMIGSLMYLTSLRPDIMFAVCAYARYQVNLKVLHLDAVKKIFRYLKGQQKISLWYPKDSPFDLVAYTDSDYAGASLDRKSTTGGKEPESTSASKEKVTKTTGKFTQGSKSHQKTNESAPAEESMQTTKDLEEPSHQEFKIGAADDQPVTEASQHPEWFQQQKKPPTLDRA